MPKSDNQPQILPVTEKETTMQNKTAARKTTAHKTATAKETTMTKTATQRKPATDKTAVDKTAVPATDKPSGQDAIRVMMDERAALVAELRVKHADAALIDQPVNFVTGRPLNKDAAVVDDLRYIAAEYGWTDNRFATAGQIKANGGTVAKDAHSDVMFFSMGDKLKYYRIYNIADVTWKDGTMPTELRKSAKRSTPKPKKSAPKRKTANKAADNSEVEDLKSMVAALMQQNAALLAALAK